MEKDTATKLLARVRKLREARGLSQEAFAEKAGLGYKYYQHVEAARRRDIRLSTLERLAQACGMKLHELLDFEHEPSALAEDNTSAPAPAGPSPAKRTRVSYRRKPSGKTR